MPRMIITHAVADVDTWLSFKDERAGAISGMGASDVRDHVAPDGSKAVAVSCSTDDVAGMLATLENPPAELGAAMQRHGVVPPLAVYVEG